jgi:transcriptional regulator with XRE-family HTH domain
VTVTEWRVKAAARKMTTSSLDPDLPTTQPNLGRRLKALRTSRGLSLKTVAAATDLSASFISMVETGQNEITVGRLIALADFYEVGLADLIPAGEGPVVLRRDDRSTSESPEGQVRTELLSDSSRGDMTGGFITFEADTQLNEPAGAGRAFVLVLSGALRIEFTGECAVSLGDGDAVWFEAGRPHRFTNPGDGPARIFTLRQAR